MQFNQFENIKELARLPQEQHPPSPVLTVTFLHSPSLFCLHSTLLTSFPSRSPSSPAPIPIPSPSPPLPHSILLTLTVWPPSVSVASPSLDASSLPLATWRPSPRRQKPADHSRQSGMSFLPMSSMTIGGITAKTAIFWVLSTTSMHLSKTGLFSSY